MAHWNRCSLVTSLGRYQCQWRYYQSIDGFPRASLDLVLAWEVDSEQSEESCVGIADTVTLDQSLPVLKYLQEQLVLARRPPESTLLKLILPCVPGYVVKSDLLTQRLECVGSYVSKVRSFLQPLQHVSPPIWNGASSEGLMEGMSSAVAMINLAGQDVILLDRLESDLVCRISLPWLSSIPITRKRIAVVVEPVNVLQTRRRWECAAALGMDLVVISTGDWFPDSHELRYLREGFIVTDITPNAGLATRIVDAVRSYPLPIDGIYTTGHHWLIAVADAAEILGLPTAPATAYRIACDKSETRALEPGDASVLVSGVEDLNSRAELRESLHYPVVVKPVNSDGSECVFKVADVTELEAAVVRAAGHRNSGRVLIEPYIDGPEFDVNLVLCDGEVVFCEISDDFPSAADHQSGLGFDAPHFGETRVVMPSVLPAREQTLIEQSMGASVRRQGFRHGVFHVEGRVRQSSVRFQQLDDGLGSLDLRPAKVAPDSETSEPSVYLHEVNARPPGYNSCTSSLVTYGVDYWALQILCAVEDWQRVGLLSQGFIGGAQGAAMVMNAVVAVDVSLVKQIHPEIDPVTITRRLPVGPMDPMGELRQTHPSLTQSVVQSIAVLSSGRSYGNEASTWWWLATFLLFASRREDILLIGEDLTRKYESIVHRANAAARYCMPGTVGRTKY